MLVGLPVVIPLLTACACLLLRGRTRWQRRIALVSAGLVLAAAVGLLAQVLAGGVLTLQVGNWPAPFGISLVADPLSGLLVVTAAVLFVIVAAYSVGDIDARRQRFGYFAFLHLLLAGVNGAFLTGDLFNLYVWFEVMLIASFVLLTLGPNRAQVEAGVKYVTLSLLSSALFLAGVGLTYGVARTLSLADLPEQLAQAGVEQPWLITAIGVLLLVSFSIKAAVVPLHFWLPASYHTPPSAVTAIFAALLTKVGVYAMLRVFGTVFPESPFIFTLLLVLGGVTMVVGVLGAVAQFHIRRILSVHIISQIGYMVLGIGFLLAPGVDVRRAAIAAVIFYVVHNMLVKTHLILVGGVVKAMRGDERLERLGGMLQQAPWLAALFLISALSLAGLPPSTGFWAKLGIVRAGFAAEQYFLTAVALGVGALTLVSMIKIWTYVFWKPAAEGAAVPERPLSRAELGWRLGPCVALGLLIVVLGLYPQPLLAVANAAAEVLAPGAEAEVVAVEGVAPAVAPEEALRS